MVKVKTVRRVSTALRSPLVQKMLAWVLPIVFGWILSKLDTKPRQKKK